MRQFIQRALLIGLTLPALPSRAEIIIDDFDDPAEVVSPEMEAVPVLTENVGQLQATRSIYIFGTRSRPEARLDSSIIRASKLNGELTALHPIAESGGLMRFGTGYTFDRPYDLTENGHNNSLLLDFASLEGPTPPTLLLCVVNGGADVLSIDLTNQLLPGTVVLPFDLFVGRGGGSPGRAFSTVSSLYFELFMFNSGIQNQRSLFALDQIRAGYTVPEHSTIGFFAVGVCVIMSFLWADPTYRWEHVAG